MRCTAFIHPIVVLLAALLAAPEAATAQDIVVRVNGGPVTSYNVAQRMRWNNRTNNFGERIKARLIGDATGKEFRRRLMAAQPHNQAEAQQVAERIKKELIEDAKKQVLSEEDPATRKAMIEALIEDRLKLLEAKRLGIEIGDSEVEEALAARAGTGADGKPDLTHFIRNSRMTGSAARPSRRSFARSSPGAMRSAAFAGREPQKCSPMIAKPLLPAHTKIFRAAIFRS